MFGPILSLLGMYNQDPTVINSTNFPLPDGLSHETLDPLLLAETAELELLYPEPNTLKTVIKAWAVSRNPQWARMLLALTEEYNPIHNYDRTETWTEDHERSLSVEGSNSGQNSRTVDVTGSSTDTLESSETEESSGTASGESSGTSQGSGTDLEQVAGFNQGNALVNKGQNTKSDSSTVSSETESSQSGTRETSREDQRTVSDSRQTEDSGAESSEFQRTDTDEGTTTREGHIRGNIGVTTSAQMISGELEIRKTSIYQIIIHEFVKMFCIGVY